MLCTKRRPRTAGPGAARLSRAAQAKLLSLPLHSRNVWSKFPPHFEKNLSEISRWDMPTYASTNSPSRQARKAQETVSKLYKRNLIYRNLSATRTSLHFPYPWLSILIQSSLEATLQHVLPTSSVCLPPGIISEGYLSVSCWYKAAEDKWNPWYRPRHLTEDQPVYL